ncbi:MAG: ATP-binding cassette domain-containing protein [Psittacicella sp.]
MIKLDNIHFTYPNNPIDFYFNLEIKIGEKIALVGKSGKGKSTLLNLIAGFNKPISGKIYLNNKDYTKLDPDKRPLSILFQKDNLFSHMTLYKNIAIGIKNNTRLNSKQNISIQNLSKELEVDTILDRFPHEVSGGQAQKIAIIRSVLREKPILLLDEPLTGLDPKSRKNTINILSKITKQYNLTLCIATHHLDEIESIVNRIIEI